MRVCASGRDRKIYIYIRDRPREEESTFIIIISFSGTKYTTLYLKNPTSNFHWLKTKLIIFNNIINLIFQIKRRKTRDETAHVNNNKNKLVLIYK